MTLIANAHRDIAQQAFLHSHVFCIYIYPIYIYDMNSVKKIFLIYDFATLTPLLTSAACRNVNQYLRELSRQRNNTCHHGNAGRVCRRWKRELQCCNGCTTARRSCLCEAKVRDYHHLNFLLWNVLGYSYIACHDVPNGQWTHIACVVKSKTGCRMVRSPWTSSAISSTLTDGWE